MKTTCNSKPEKLDLATLKIKLRQYLDLSYLRGTTINFLSNFPLDMFFELFTISYLKPRCHHELYLSIFSEMAGFEFLRKF